MNPSTLDYAALRPLKVFKYFMIRRGLRGPRGLACEIVPWIMLRCPLKVFKYFMIRRGHRGPLVPLKVFKYFMMIKYLILFVACFVVNVFYL